MKVKVSNYYLCDSSISVIFDDGSISTIANDNALYSHVVSLLDAGKWDKVKDKCNLADMIKSYSGGAFYILDGVTYIGDEKLPKALADRLLQFAEANLPISPLVNFWNNVKLNPSESSKQELFGFLEANKIPLTPDGCFLAYKKVRENFKDCYTGTIDNSVGTTVKMDRAAVDSDRFRTCSDGLHVAALDYAKDFQSGVLLKVKVNPANVVSVPNDYNNQKMRVCEYNVVEVVPPILDERLVANDDNSDYTEKHEYNPNDDDEEIIEEDDDFEDEDDNYDDDFEDEEEDGELLDTVYQDDRGCIRLKSFVLEKIGAGVGDTVGVYKSDDGLTVSKLIVAGEKVGSYTVDTRHNVRISRLILSLGDIDTQGSVGVSIYYKDGGLNLM